MCCMDAFVNTLGNPILAHNAIINSFCADKDLSWDKSVGQK